KHISASARIKAPDDVPIRAIERIKSAVVRRNVNDPVVQNRMGVNVGELQSRIELLLPLELAIRDIERDQIAIAQSSQDLGSVHQGLRGSQNRSGLPRTPAIMPEPFSRSGIKRINRVIRSRDEEPSGTDRRPRSDRVAKL